MKKNRTPEISPYETRVLLLLRKGYTNRKIGLELGTSANTVKYHLKNIYRKLGVCNRVEAINNYSELTHKQIVS